MARAALVTGGSSGIGYAIARMLSHEGYGVTIASRTRERLDRAAGELGAHAVAGDVSREDDCHRIVTEHSTRFERLDVLVNSAGVDVGARIEDMRTKHWDLRVDVNLRG